jgi:sister chromatid cohesion protein PDS5
VLGITAALQSKMLDMEEKVRAVTCKIFSQLDYETALHHISVELLKALSDRIMDKKAC